MGHIVKFTSRAELSSEELARAVIHAVRDEFEDYTIKDDKLYKKVVINRRDDIKLEEVPKNTISEYRYSRIKAALLVAKNIKMALGIVE